MSEKLKEAIGTILYFGLVICVTLLFIKYVAQRTVVDGQSMEPTLQNADNLIVDKISYRFSDPERFDVVVFPPYENADKTYYIKRIIGLPGETVHIDTEGNCCQRDMGRKLFNPLLWGGPPAKWCLERTSIL